MFAILNSIQLLKIKIKIKRRFTFEKLFATLLTSILILGACSMHHDTSKNDEDNKSDMKSNDPKKKTMKLKTSL